MTTNMANVILSALRRPATSMEGQDYAPTIREITTDDKSIMIKVNMEGLCILCQLTRRSSSVSRSSR